MPMRLQREWVPSTDHSCSRSEVLSIGSSYTYKTLHCTYFMAAYIFTVNPLLSVIAYSYEYSDNLCMSYTFFGVLEMVVS